MTIALKARPIACPEKSQAVFLTIDLSISSDIRIEGKEVAGKPGVLTLLDGSHFAMLRGTKRPKSVSNLRDDQETKKRRGMCLPEKRQTSVLDDRLKWRFVS